MMPLEWSLLKGSQLKFPELCMLKPPATSLKAGRATSVKFPVTSRAPMVANFAKPLMSSNAVLLAIKRAPPPVLVSAGMEMLVRAELATMERSLPVLVKFGAIRLVMKLDLMESVPLTAARDGMEISEQLLKLMLAAHSRLGNSTLKFRPLAWKLMVPLALAS